MDEIKRSAKIAPKCYPTMTLKETRRVILSNKDSRSKQMAAKYGMKSQNISQPFENLIWCFWWFQGFKLSVVPLRSEELEL